MFTSMIALKIEFSKKDFIKSIGIPPANKSTG